MSFVAIAIICLVVGASFGILAAALASAAKSDYRPIKDEFESKNVGPTPINTTPWTDKD